MMFSSTCKKALVVATVALTLPVLGSSAAFAGGPADSGGKGSGKGGTSATASGHGKGSETDKSGSSANPDGTFQGKSRSTPDQDGKGMDRGADNNDKTGPGTDGNNGCGNEPRSAAPRDGGRPTDDDNNGRCGSKPRSTKPSTGKGTQSKQDGKPAGNGGQSAGTPAPAGTPATAGKPAKADKPAHADKPAKVDKPSGARPAPANGQTGPGRPADRPNTQPAAPATPAPAVGRVQPQPGSSNGAPAPAPVTDPSQGDVAVKDAVATRPEAPSAAPADVAARRGTVVDAPAGAPVGAPVEAPVVGAAGNDVLRAQAGSAPRALPFTGAPVGLLLLAAGVTAGVGTGLVLLGRRRRTS